MKRILRTGESCWVREAVEETGVLVDGKSYYSMFYQAALKAEKHILLSGWQSDSKVALVREASQLGPLIRGFGSSRSSWGGSRDPRTTTAPRRW